MLVGVGQPAGGIRLEDGFREDLRQLPEALLAGPQGHLGGHVSADLGFQLGVGPLQIRVGLGKLAGAFGDLLLKEMISFLKAFQGIDLPFPDQMIGDGNAAVGDLPAAGLAVEDEHQPSRLPGQDVILHGQVNMEEGGRHGDRIGQGLDRQVLQVDADRLRHLGEVLAGDGDPFHPALDQGLASPGEAGKIITELPGQLVVAG